MTRTFGAPASAAYAYIRALMGYTCSFHVHNISIVEMLQCGGLVCFLCWSRNSGHRMLLQRLFVTMYDSIQTKNTAKCEYLQLFLAFDGIFP